MKLPGYILLVLYCVLVGICTPIKSMGQSSPIVHQEFKDVRKDWKYGWEYQPLKGSIMGHSNSDIRSVSFSSDGKFLNSTVWVTPNETYSSPKVTYGILFDADSNNNTGVKGADYVLETMKANDNSTDQVMQLVELSSGGSIRISYNTTVSTDFKKGYVQGYVHMDLDLRRIGYPPEYLVKYFTNDTFEINGTSKMIIDDTPWYSIPVPRIQLIVSPNPITLNPGQHGFVDLQVISNASIPLSVHVKYQDRPGINFVDEQFTFKDNVHFRNLILPPNGHGYTRFVLRATDYAINDATYTIPLEVSIFPKEFGAGVTLPVGKFVGGFDVKIHKFGISDSLTTLKEELGEVWKDNKDIVILVIGAFVTPFAAYLITNYTRRRKLKK